VSGKKRSGIGGKVVRENGHCARCGSRTVLEGHHVIAIADGGPDVESNIEVLCEKCHREWHRDLEGVVTFETFLDSIPVWFTSWMREKRDGHDVHVAWMMYRWINLGGSLEAESSGWVRWVASPSASHNPAPRRYVHTHRSSIEIANTTPQASGATLPL
jgi:hypothetical protein